MFVLSLNACKESSDNRENGDKISSSSVRLQNLKTPIDINENAKLVAELVKPYFEDKNSEIIVIVETGDKNILKSDLSNQREANLAIFQNLGDDTINRNFIEETDFKKTAVFGRNFKEPGIKKIRGYVMEYYGFEIYPGYDITNDTLNSDKVSRTFFETEIEIVSE